jgi:hypothetical protein
MPLTTMSIAGFFSSCAPVRAKDASKYGFRVHSDWVDLTLLQLRDQIDEDFWVLSTAHYDRYLATPDLFSEK